MDHESVSVTTNSGEQIVLELSNYPPVEEVVDVLEEDVSMAQWPDVALGYYRLGRYDEFIRLLERAEKKKMRSDQAKEQMRCLDLLAAYYVRKGRTFRNEKERKDYFTKATILYTTADKLMMYDPIHLVGRAYFCLLEAVKSGQAKAQFEYVINYRGDDSSAVIGRALESYIAGDYVGALEYFRKGLLMKPDLPAEVRLGFGHCYLKLKDYEKAKAAFNRVIVLDPSNLSARIALAVCLFHEGDPIAEKALTACYNVDATNPVILNQLANMYFLNDQIDKAEETAWAAYNNAVQKELKAESCYMIARCHHYKREYDKAWRYYHQSTSFGNAKFVLPYFGLGQIHLGKAEFDQAIECFEKVLAEYPGDYETSKVLGSIYTRYQGPVVDDKTKEMQRKGEELLCKILEMYPDDLELIFELAQLQEATNPAEALKKYEKGCGLMKAMGDVIIPAEVFVNMGALNFQLGNYAEAKLNYEIAEESLRPNGGLLLSDENEAKYAAVKYNLGRLYEELSKLDVAETIYYEILFRKPNHTDSILRLGCIYRERGDSTKAFEEFKRAAEIDADSELPHLFMANLHISKHEFRLARTCFESVVKMKDHKDNAFALIGLGNTWLEALHSVRKGEKDEKEKIARFQEYALGCYMKVLKHHPHNAWAANGIGAVLAFKGQLQDAREVFSYVRESAPDHPNIFLNMAHINMENKQYQVALQIYKNIMKRENLQFDIQLMQFAARAAWKCGNWNESRDLLQRCALEAPNNLLVKYSLAVVIQCMATQVMRETKSTLSDFYGAVEDYKAAEKTFVYLSQQPDDVIANYRYISRSTCKAEAGICRDLLIQARQLYNNAQRKEKEAREKQERIKAEREEANRLKEEKEREERLKQQEMEEELRKQRAFYVEKTKEILKVSQVIEEKEKEKEGKKKSGGRRKKDKDAGDDFLNDSDEFGNADGGDGEERKKKKKDKQRGKRRREREEGGSGSEGENKAPKKKRKTKKAVVEEEPARKGKVKSRAYVSSSSSSESDEQEKPQQAAPSGVDEEEEEALLPTISEDSDLSDSPQEEENASENERPVAKKARIEDDDSDEDNAPQSPSATSAPASPAQQRIESDSE